jgi:REP element-mobilizing transposase RayT
VYRHPHRLTQLDARGTGRHFLTICCRERRAVFVASSTVDPVVRQFLTVAGASDVAVLAYCVMPDHVHLLVESGDVKQVAEFVRLSKQRSSFHYRRETGRLLWQPSYFDRTLRNGEDLFPVLRYLIENPVRAKLCNDVRAYPFWGSPLYSRDELLEFAGRGARDLGARDL